MKTTFLNRNIIIELTIKEAQDIYKGLNYIEEGQESDTTDFLHEQLETILMKGTKDESH